MQIKKIAITLLISSVSIFYTQNLFSQEINLDEKLTVNFKSEKLKTVLEYIENESNVLFTYNNQKINDQQIVTIVARNKSLQTILEQLFNQLDIEFTTVEKQIVLKPEIDVPEKVETVETPQKQQYTISGFLKDNETGESLIGASVYVENQFSGTTTNEYGFYSLTLTEGNYNLIYTYIGYLQQKESVKLYKNQKIDKNLILNEISINLVVITEETGRDILDVNPLKNIKFDTEKFKRNKGITGEPDLMQTIRSISGVNFYGDGSVYFYTRGGNRDQNLIIIDEAPVYNPAHLLGFVPAIAPEAINDIRFYKNDFPIKYGNALSSITDIYLKEGNKQRFGFSAILNPVASTFSFEGPLKKDKHSYIVTLRKSNVNWLLSKFISGTGVNFYDFHTKFNFKINEKRRLYFSFYNSKDEILLSENIENEQSLSWTNTNFSLRMNKMYSEKLFSNVSLIASNYNYFLYTNLNKSSYWNSNIGNLSLKYDFSFYKKENVKHKFGANLNYYFFNPGNLENEYYTRIIKTGNAREFVLYFGNETKPSDKFLISTNIRTSIWNNVGEAVVYFYNYETLNLDTLQNEKGKFHSTLNIEPRFSLSYSISNNSLIKFSYDKTTQNLHQLSNSTSPFTTLDVWFPSGINLKSQKANQIVFSFLRKFDEIDFNMSFYYKKLKNQIEYDEHANMLLNPLIELQLKIGTIKSYGIEFWIAKQKGDFNFNFSYTYSRVQRFTYGINNNSTYSATYDKPHNLNFEIGYDNDSFWNITLNWTYSSGAKYSKPIGFYYFQNYTVPIYDTKNNARLPDYHRLDLNIGFDLNKNSEKLLKHKIVISIFNVYGRKNIMSINYNKIETENGSYYVPANYNIENQLLTTKIWLSGIITMITYSIKY